MLDAIYVNDILNSMEINDGEVLQEVSDLNGEVDRQQGKPAHNCKLANTSWYNERCPSQ